MIIGCLTLISVISQLCDANVQNIILSASCSDVADSRYLDREIVPETRKDEFVLVRPSVAFLIQQSAGTSRPTALT
jgi:hypothetical protein